MSSTTGSSDSFLYPGTKVLKNLRGTRDGKVVLFRKFLEELM
jgi:hypothetical protein